MEQFLFIDGMIVRVEDFKGKKKRIGCLFNLQMEMFLPPP